MPKLVNKEVLSTLSYPLFEAKNTGWFEASINPGNSEFYLAKFMINLLFLESLITLNLKGNFQNSV